MKRCPKCKNTFPDEANFCPVDAGRLELVAPGAGTDDGLIGGRFTVSGRIGGGRTGEVYQAVDTSTGRPCAVKLIHESVFSSPLLAQRTERELKQLESLDSAHVVKVLAHGKRGNQLWMASELAGGSLERLLAAQGPQPPGRAVDIALAIGRGLSDAARTGVVHRDLAPKNVLIDGAEIKLVNFGVPVPGSRDVPGVPEFVSPEQVEGKPVDQRSNIYSLGAILYALLTGRPPFVGELQAVHAQHLAGGAPPPSALAPGSPALDALVMKALERQPARRFMTLRQFVEELEKLALIAEADGTQPMGMVHGVAAVGVGGKTKKKALAQTMMGGFQTVDAPPADAPSTTQRMGSAPVVAAPPVAGPAPHVTPLSIAPTEPVTSLPPAAAPAPYAPPAPQVAAPAHLAPPFTAAPAPPSMSHPDMSKSNGQGEFAGGKGKGKQPAARKESSKGKFRETMWFKKGELDAAAAAEAAKQKGGDLPAPDKADALPIEDRYGDDGSLSTEDRGKYSLRTGHTQQMAAMRADQIPRPSRGGAVSENELVREMKRPVVVWLLPLLGLIIAAIAAFFLLR